MLFKKIVIRNSSELIIAAMRKKSVQYYASVSVSNKVMFFYLFGLYFAATIAQLIIYYY